MQPKRLCMNWCQRNRPCPEFVQFLLAWMSADVIVENLVVCYALQFDRSLLADNHRSWRISDEQTIRAKIKYMKIIWSFQQFNFRKYQHLLLMGKMWKMWKISVSPSLKSNSFSKESFSKPFPKINIYILLWKLFESKYFTVHHFHLTFNHSMKNSFTWHKLMMCVIDMIRTKLHKYEHWTNVH